MVINWFVLIFLLAGCGRPAPERTPGLDWKSVDDEEAVSDARLVIALAIEARDPR